MILNKKTLISLILVIILIIFGIYYYNNSSPEDNKALSNLDKLSIENPKLSSYVDEVNKSLGNLKKEDVKTYMTLGLAWKSLADQTRDKEYYAKAYKVYEEGVNLTQRKNTVFILNAGNMAVYLGDYGLAKQYYEEAISVAPGDLDGYLKLIDLHKYKLKSGKDEIVAIFDKGIKRMLNPAYLKQLKESYLKSLESSQ